ncbi:multicopper oxidase family protein [Bacillus tianshenii]|nr:multicopper oxidase family protein [Bacillus tianshenii]
MNKRYLLIPLLVLSLTGCQAIEQESQAKETSILEIPTKQVDESNVKEFELTAQKTDWQIKDQTFEAWTYNGSVPGEEIRVQEGDWVRVHLKNKLDEPVTIHWHGMILPNQMDGVAGVTQDAVQPGDTFTYEFQAKEPGTYWYHSHQHSSYQVDRGLYGALIVEPKDKTYDKDAVLLVDEWPIGETKPMGGNMHSNTGIYGEMDTQQQYGTFTINGKSAPHISALEFNKGENVRLRFINAGYQKHYFYLGKQQYKLVGNDGNPVQDSELTQDVLEIAPGERIDIEFTADVVGESTIYSPIPEKISADIDIPMIIKGEKETNSHKEPSQLQVIDYTQTGEMKPLFKDDVKPTIEYTMNLSVGMGMGMMNDDGMAFTVNGETFPETPPLKVEKGDLIKVTLNNNSMLDHPMHLHGHHFQVISKNGEKLDKPLVKDLINVKPHQQYEILFKADNPGHWLFHCHDLVHAGGGMVSIIKYNGYTTPFELGGVSENEPE